MKWITWIEEDGTELRRNGRSDFDHRKVCQSSGSIVIVHRDIEGSALQVGVRGINTETPTTTPSNLQGVQEDRGSSEGENLQLMGHGVRVRRPHVL